jgi:hypothetical protein
MELIAVDSADFWVAAFAVVVVGVVLAASASLIVSLLLSLVRGWSK